MRFKISALPYIIACSVILFGTSLYAQDSTRAVRDSTNIQEQVVEEQVLTAISIIAVVERPSVAIVPRRDRPRFESIMFLDRNFDRELKAIPVKLITLDEELESAKKIERLKKLLVKENK